MSDASLRRGAGPALRFNIGSQKLHLMLALGCIVLTGFIPDISGSSYWSYSIQYVNLLIAAAVAQNVLLDDANQVSFGQGAIFGVGAYAVAIGMSVHGMPWYLAAIAATVVSGIAGLIYAIPALRVQGYYLGFVTLSAASVYPEFLFIFDSYTNGINGISTPSGAWRDPLLFGISGLSLATTAVAAIAVIGHFLLRRSALGRRIRIAGHSPEAAQTLGIRPGVVRCLVFCAVSAFTGAAGTLYPPIVGFVSPAAFHLELSILLFLAVIVGGRGQILGPLAGIYLLYLLPNVLLVNLIDYRLLAYGVIALLVMLVMPDGLVGSIVRRFHRQPAAGGLSLAAGSLPFPVAAPGIAGRATISVSRACKAFGAVKAINDVDLEVSTGKIVGLVGANGSGKTSLINAITGFSRLDSGEIRIGGQSVTRMSPAAIARLRVGRTFQTPRIFESMSAWENIAIGAEANQRAMMATETTPLAALRENLQGVSTERIPHGQRRTIEVFRVILTGCEMILLDEPAAGLSNQERAELCALLLHLRDEGGRAIILVEHDLDLVWQVADEVLVMESGRIVSRGTPGEVRADPAVRNFFI